jgi:acetyl-CoA carboxylase biotin carboxyl carrier protein
MTDTSPTPPSGEVRPSVEGIRALATLCQQAGVEVLEASVGQWSVRLRFDLEGAGALTTAQPEPVEPVDETPQLVLSEWVGVFRRSLDGGPPLAAEGRQVKEGDVIGLIEAMQLMHEQRSDRTGTVVRFLVEDGSPVEYGQPLLELV